MFNLLKESFSLYKINFKRAFGIMLPVLIIGLPITFNLKSIESNLSALLNPFILAYTLFSLLILLVVLIWSQVSLFNAIKSQDKSIGLIKLYRLGCKEYFSSLKALWKSREYAKGRCSFVIKNLLFIFIIWFLFNGGIAGVLTALGLIDKLLFEQIVFGSINFLFLFPLFHMYVFSLFQKLKA